MNLGIVLSSQSTSFSAIPFKESLEVNIDKIKKLGYDGAELAVRDPSLINVDWLNDLLVKYNMSIPAIQTGQAFFEEGLSFVNTDQTIRRKAVERIKSHIRLAKNFNALVIAGLILGQKKEGIDNNEVTTLLIESLKECGLTDRSVRLAIEPINRYETELINTVESGLALVREVDMENVGLLLDTFHMNIEEPSITDSILSARDHLFHVHVADSNRWYPGAGHIDFAEIVDTLNEINYQGFVSAEILPYPDPDTAAVKTIEYMRKFI